MTSPESFLKYPKVNTIWKRTDKDKKGTIIEGDFADPIFPNILKWETTEKIHGENTRIILHNGNVSYHGKTDDAELKESTLQYLQETFPLEKMKEKFPASNKVAIYGEICGELHHHGKGYCGSEKLILFDVMVTGEDGHKWWLERTSIEDIASFFGIEPVPLLGIMTIDEIITMVKSEYKSKIAENPNMTAEGIVAKAYPMVLNRSGEPIMLKLKAEDYRKLKAKKQGKNQPLLLQ